MTGRVIFFAEVVVLNEEHPDRSATVKSSINRPIVGSFLIWLRDFNLLIAVCFPARVTTRRNISGRYYCTEKICTQVSLEESTRIETQLLRGYNPGLFVF